MYGKTFTALAVLVILAAGVALFVLRSGSDAGKTYANSVHGYELTYPRDLDAKEYTDDDTVFGTIEGDTVRGVAEARVIVVQGEPGQSARDAVSERLKDLCAADGPTESFSCTGVLSTEPFATAHGDEGYVLMLKGELTDLKTKNVTQVPKGPYYVLPLSNAATASKVLVVAPPLNMSASEADSARIESIAVSARRTK